MFKLKPNPTFWAKVEIPVPGADPDTIQFEFRHKTRDEALRFTETLLTRPVLDQLTEIVVNWSGADGEYTTEALGRLTRDFIAAPDRIMQVYLDELRGARRKN